MSEDGGGNKKLVLVGLLLGLIVGAGGGFMVFKAIGGGDIAPSSNVGDDTGAQETAETEPEIDPRDLAPVKFERMALPIYRDMENGRRQFVGNYFIDFSLMVSSDGDQVLVRRSKPQLQHAFLTAIAENNMMRADSPQEIDNDRLAALLKRIANDVLGEKIVHLVAIDSTLRVSG